jgi:hypothetical protein
VTDFRDVPIPLHDVAQAGVVHAGRGSGTYRIVTGLHDHEGAQR